MTPEQKIKYTILTRAECDMGEVNAENIDDIYEDAFSDNYDVQDKAYEFREGDVETGIECDYSRYYECKSVAAKTPDGSWVGWTYWYGGGKHGNPEEIEWMEHAYDLDVSEEEKLVTVQTFTKA